MSERASECVRKLTFFTFTVRMYYTHSAERERGNTKRVNSIVARVVFFTLSLSLPLLAVVVAAGGAVAGAVAFVVALHYIPFELAAFIHEELYHFFVCMCWSYVCVLSMFGFYYGMVLVLVWVLCVWADMW